MREFAGEAKDEGPKQTSKPAGRNDDPRLRVARLQVTVGNRATGQMLQRMPTVQELQEKAGFSGGTKYSDLLDTVQFYHQLLRQKIGYDADQVQNQGDRLLDYLGRIQYLAGKYAKEHTWGAIRDTRTKRVSELAEQAEIERGIVRHRMRLWKQKVSNGVKNGPTWAEIMPKGMSAGAINLDKAGAVKQGKKSGGTSTVTHYKLGDDSEGFFKQDKSKIETEEWVDRDNLTKNQVAPGKFKKDHKQQTLEWNILQGYGYKAKSPDFTRKAVATSRIDELLNAGVAAKTRMAYKTKGGKKVFGSFQTRAKGDNLAEFDEKNNLKLDETDNPAQLSLADPNLQRQWSKLNILDALTGQLDRHGGNIFAKLGAQGNVESITGIDHDMSFPPAKFMDPSEREAGRPWTGLPQNIDEEIVEMVMALEPADLRLVLKDLLTQEELNGVYTRLARLKQELPKRKLLKPDQWSKQTAQQEVTDTSQFVPHGYLGSARQRRRQVPWGQMQQGN
jgi:hypothetical protein